MAKYHNIMEDILEQEFDELKHSLNCCDCDQCRSDIIALALNQVRPRYVVTLRGGLMSKIEYHQSQELADVRGALTRASIMVTEKPRH